MSTTVQTTNNVCVGFNTIVSIDGGSLTRIDVGEIQWVTSCPFMVRSLPTKGPEGQTLASIRASGISHSRGHGGCGPFAGGYSPVYRRNRSRGILPLEWGFQLNSNQWGRWALWSRANMCW